MPTTFSSIVPVRRVVVGDCLGPQGRDGTDELTRTAFEALKAANWTENPASPSFPVHEYDRAMPSGDAWKACYGYSASARTQRAACGAVCYTFALPADAVASGNVANVTKIALSVTGDRYLDAGVDLHLLLSDSATPPTVAEWLAGPSGEIVSAALCATSDQAPTKPNQRNGETAAVEVEPTSAAARAYLHVALLLHDYLSTREGWIEGGAMLDGAAVALTFSRDVAADTQETATIRILRATKHSSSASRTLSSMFTLILHYGYRYASSNAVASFPSDAFEVVRLAFRGIIAPAVSTRQLQIQSNNGYFLYCTSGLDYDSGDKAFRLYLDMLVYATPYGLKAGMFVSVPFSSQGSEGAGRFALLQIDSSPLEMSVSDSDQYGVGETIAISQQPAIDQVINGKGSDLVGFVDYSVPAKSSGDNMNDQGTSFNLTTFSVQIPISVAPTKRFLVVVAIPFKNGMDIVHGESPVLFAT